MSRLQCHRAQKDPQGSKLHPMTHIGMRACMHIYHETPDTCPLNRSKEEEEEGKTYKRNAAANAVIKKGV